MGPDAGLLYPVLSTLLPCFGLLLDALQLLQPVPVGHVQGHMLSWCNSR